LTTSSHGLTTGSYYKIRYKGTNAVKGAGTPSDTLLIALVDQPSASTGISKITSLSSKTSIRLEWDPVTVPADQLPNGAILGYVVSATAPNGTTWEVFNGYERGLRDQVTTTVTGLDTGSIYSFKVVAWNLNGPGLASSSYQYYSCVHPSGFAAPQRVSSTISEITISW
jgi:hypothetical protein